MYKLYGSLRSGSTTVELTLAELGVEYEFVNVSLENEDQRGSEFRKLNPQGKVPALICNDGTILTESVAIILWLLETHKDTRLLPSIGSSDRAQALKWLLFIASDLYQLIEIWDYPERFATDGDPEDLRSRTEQIWKERWSLIESNITGPWLLGDRFSVTDIYIAIVSGWAGLKEWRKHHLPQVEQIVTGVSQRPACMDVWSRNFDPL